MLFWDLPSYLLRFSLGEILGFAAYQMTYALLESVFVTLVIAGLTLLLPVRWIGERFSVTGSLFALAFGLGSIILKQSAVILIWLAETLRVSSGTAGMIVVGVWAFVVAGLPAAALLGARHPRTQAAVNKFLESLIVLRGIYLALSVPAVLVVLYRNLF